jgi:biotin carboxyl carrier protein
VLAGEGDEVAEGQPVMILEAMKMQNEIKAPRSGTLRRLNAQAGETVEAGAVLFSVE